MGTPLCNTDDAKWVADVAWSVSFTQVTARATALLESVEIEPALPLDDYVESDDEAPTPEATLCRPCGVGVGTAPLPPLPSRPRGHPWPLPPLGSLPKPAWAVLLIVGSGPEKRADGLAASSARHGSLAIEVDELIGMQYTGDRMANSISDDAQFALHRQHLQSGHTTSVHGAGNCDTFSTAREGGPSNAPAAELRTRDEPELGPRCPPSSVARVLRENECWRRITVLASDAFHAGGEFTIEAPIDRGDETSPHYRPWWARHVPVWLLPCICGSDESVGLIEETGAVRNAHVPAVCTPVSNPVLLPEVDGTALLAAHGSRAE